MPSRLLAALTSTVAFGAVLGGTVTLDSAGAAAAGSATAGFATAGFATAGSVTAGSVTAGSVTAGSVTARFATADRAGTPPARADGAERLCGIGDPRVIESSGLAASRRHPGILYTFNDSGGEPELYAIGPDCRTRATLRFAGARNRDWEAMAIGADGLYVGDIGDNTGTRPYVTIYRVTEPATMRSQTLPATAFHVKYPGGPRDAETLMIDPRDNRLYIASKELSGSLYEAPKTLRAGGFTVMRKVADAPLFATDGAFSPGGRTFVIRTYWNADIYSAPGETLSTVSLPSQQQGEGVTFSLDGRSLLLSSEGRNQPLWRVPVPAEALPPARRTQEAPAVTGRDAAGHPKKTSRTIVLLIVAGFALGGVVMFARRRGS